MPLKVETSFNDPIEIPSSRSSSSAASSILDDDDDDDANEDRQAPTDELT